MRKKTKHIFIYIIIIVIFIILILFITKKRSGINTIERDKIISIDKYAKVLPEIEAIDIFGRKRNVKEFSGKYIYIQFFKKSTNNLIPLIENILQYYVKRGDLKVVYFLEDSEGVKADLNPNNAEIVIVSNW